MKTVKSSSVYYEMAKEKINNRQFRKIEDYIEALIQKDYENKNADCDLPGQKVAKKDFLL